MEISEEQLNALLGASGWFPERKVDVAPAVEAWTRAGCAASEAALDFVSSFDGLSVRYPRRIATQGFHDLILNAAAATYAVHGDRVREYEQRTGFSLCPVGIAASNHWFLLMSPSGAVFGGIDQFLSLCGGDGREAIWNVCRHLAPIKFIE
ncbi:SUKH-3 domain-containing protein [Spirillospora sp. NPDC049024]